SVHPGTHAWQNEPPCTCPVQDWWPKYGWRRSRELSGGALPVGCEQSAWLLLCYTTAAAAPRHSGREQHLLSLVSSTLDPAYPLRQRHAEPSRYVQAAARHGDPSC